MNTTHSATLGNITEYSLNWPGNTHGSTHELVIDKQYIYVSGQNMDQIAKCNYKGQIVDYYKMPDGSGPHGLLLDKHGGLWVSLEFFGLVVQLDDWGKIVKVIDVRLCAQGAETPINPAPHGIGLDADGETIWFTGKRTSTIGKINTDCSVEHFQLNNLAALPIFLSAGTNGNMWGTELQASAILNVSGDGTVREFKIPTSNSRPIAVIPDPSEPYMWFTEEAGVKIGKIDQCGKITEYPVPALQKNDILASLTFDRGDNLWVQVYVDQNNPNPSGYDYILKFDKSIRHIEGSDISGVPFSTHTLPSRGTVMHRIKMDHEDNLWFTEMMTDKLGKITL
ncbi:MAG: Vgb family protein [Gammaproteobacteria bacterium]